MSMLQTMKATILCLSLWLLTFVACGEGAAEHPDQKVDGWHTSIEAGCTAAEASGKPLLLVFR